MADAGKLLKDAEGSTYDRLGKVKGTRPSVAVYRVPGQTIEIWRIYHATQLRQPCGGSINS